MPTYTEPKVISGGLRGEDTVFPGTDLPNLDFMRAVAVLLVLFGHLTYFLGVQEWGPLRIIEAGILGVKIFFVHTCFVLMLSLERQWRNQNAAEFFFSFMVRRAFRIYPLSILTVSLIAAFHLPMARLDSEQFAGIPLHPGVLVSNLLLIQSSRNSILGPLWSLPYEMAMYLFLPWLFLWIVSTRSSWRLVLVWAASVLASLALLAHWGGKTNNFLLYVPCFLPGVIAYQLRRTPRRQLPAFLWPGVVIGLVLFHLWDQRMVTSAWTKGWVLCLMLGACAPFFAQISPPWLAKPSHFIAKYSYGIYLTHFFCIWLIFDRLHYVLPRIVRLPLFTMLALLLPVALYYFIEEPMIQRGKRIVKTFESRREVCAA